MNQMPLIKLTSLVNIDLIGDGVTQFLDGQLTIDTKSLEDKTAKLACFCNHKGRIVALFHILLIENGVRLILPKSTMDVAVNHIKKYSVFFKLEVLSDSLVISGANENDVKSTEQPALLKIDNTSLMINFSPNYKLDQQLDLQQNHHAEVDDSFWYYQLAEQKIAWLNQDTLEHFLPHALNLPELDAIDFKKGCFTGQEVIARMQYKGKLKQHLQKLTCLDNVTGDNSIIAEPVIDKLIIDNKQKLYQADKVVGEVVCSVNSEAQNTLVLALIKDSANLSQQFQTSLENSPILELSS